MDPVYGMCTSMICVCTINCTVLHVVFYCHVWESVKMRSIKSKTNFFMGTIKVYCIVFQITKNAIMIDTF